MLEIVLALMLQWKAVFASEPSLHRAMRLACAGLCVLGRRTIARRLLVQVPVQGPPALAPAPDAGALPEPPGAHRPSSAAAPSSDWSADYRLFSRSRWDAQELFLPMLKEAIGWCEGDLLPVALDDTHLKKTGTKVAGAHWQRDPLSPAFRVNLQWGLRFVHAAVLLPLHQAHAVAGRAIPVCFRQVTPVKKPGTKATPEQRAQYRLEVKQKNLSTEAVEVMGWLRRQADAQGAADKLLALSVDGSYCNKTVFRARLERTILIARARKDAKLCRPWQGGGRRKYDPSSFTPEQVFKDEAVAWQTCEIFHGGKRRPIQYKQVPDVLWRHGARQRRLRLLVVKPVPYRLSTNGRTFYRQPAFLLCTDTEQEARALLQVYFDRLQIEVAHQELKSVAGVGDAQVRNGQAVPRQPALDVATYSALHLASLKALGVRRSAELGRLPKWQREKTRASLADLIRYFRAEVVGSPEVVAPIGLRVTFESISAAATI